VLPATGSFTEAVLPVEEVQTTHGVVNAGFGHGKAVIGTSSGPLGTGPQSVGAGPVTETDNDTFPVAPAV
jgi:hypothetical protein